jgi:pyruvate-formate lyase-activating enzyme
MRVKNIIQEDYSNYKACAMLVGFPSCSWKCERDCNKKGLCQNAALAQSPTIEISAEEIVDLYMSNPLSRALVCGGLEPFDSWDSLIELISEFRERTNDPVIIYTGYNREEIEYKVLNLMLFKNIIIKFGRFVPDQEAHYDEILGVSLASPNQHAERIS